MGRWPVRLLGVVFLIVAGSANAAEVRIHRAEEFTLSAEKLPAAEALSKPGSQARAPASFRAFDRTFALELEDNAELLARLPAERRRAIAERAQLYGGRLQGQANSWLRLTRIGPDLYGLIFDGKEFYSVAPRRTIEPQLDSGAAPPETANSNLIYRASDMDVDFGGNFCASLRKGSKGTRSNGAEAFRTILQEIAREASAAALPTREIEVGLLGDLQFYRHQGVDSEDALLARFNIVDGIFSEQVSLRITVGYLRVFTGGGNPFTTNDAEGLLDEVSAYRESSATLQAFGLTHLVTGRPLDGDTVGVGYIDSVCDPYFGTSLSEDLGFDVTLSALVAAHELGHNFGAEHDTERGSVCQSTPDGYLMAPTINYSGTFSACSLQTMEPVINAAACIFPAKLRDVELRGIELPANTTVRAPIKVVIPVRSIGNEAVDGVDLRVSLSDFSYVPSITSATVTGGLCSIDTWRVNCSLGSMPPGETRWATVTLRSATPDYGTIYAHLTALNDMRDGNDGKNTPIQITPRVDVSISTEEVSPLGVVQEPMTSAFTVYASGVAPGENVVVRGDFASSRVESVTANAGKCAINASGMPVCTLGTVPAGEHRTVTVRYVPTTLNPPDHRVWVTALHDDVPYNESVSFSPYLQPRHALQLYAGSSSDTTVGTPVTLSAYVRTTGTQPLENTTVRVDVDEGMQVLAVTAQFGQCQPVPGVSAWVCGLPVLAAESWSRIDIVAQSDIVGEYSIRVLASSPNNDFNFDPTYEMRIRARPANDMMVWHDGDAVVAYDHRDALVFLYVTSNSLHDERKVGVRVALPSQFTIRSATWKGTACAIDGSVAFCSLGTLSGPYIWEAIELRVSSPVVGKFEGSATVFSAGDDDATNNKIKLRFDVRPNIDAGLKAPTGRTVVVGEIFQVPVQIRSASKPLTEVTFEVHPWLNRLKLDSVKLAGGTCQGNEWRATCTIDALPARDSVTVYVRAHGTQPGSDELFLNVSTPGDVDYSNNGLRFPVTIEPAPPP